MSEPEHPHAEPAELGRWSRPPARGSSRGEHLVALAGIRAEADRPADMVEHDLRLGKVARRVNEIVELGVVHPRIKAETERFEPGKARAHPRILQQT